MVTRAELPRISWEENFTPEDDSRVSTLVVETLLNELASPADGYEQLFFVVPTPTPYMKAEAEMLSALNTSETASRDLRILTLPHGGRCYSVSDVEKFRKLLPHAFRLGPPEITLIAANCEFGATAEENKFVDFVCAALQSAPSAAKRNIVGMHFDSGDLVELF